MTCSSKKMDERKLLYRFCAILNNPLNFVVATIIPTIAMASITAEIIAPNSGTS
jgi:hypothetical protein